MFFRVRIIGRNGERIANFTAGEVRPGAVHDVRHTKASAATRPARSRTRPAGGFARPAAFAATAATGTTTTTTTTAAALIKAPEQVGGNSARVLHGRAFHAPHAVVHIGDKRIGAEIGDNGLIQADVTAAAAGIADDQAGVSAGCRVQANFRGIMGAPVGLNVGVADVGDVFGFHIETPVNGHECAFHKAPSLGLMLSDAAHQHTMRQRADCAKRRPSPSFGKGLLIDETTD